jgi:uroporphyrin-III C-methyltransferase
MSGKVYLIGAGPGDPELMTLKAVRALARCDVVLVDDLVHRGCLAHAKPGARVLEVGKRCGALSTSQLFIEGTMVESARAGYIVGRLKGGDPFVFGRGGEEMQALMAAGVVVEVIPGITSGIAAPAALGIPITHRDLAHGVTFVTGHGADIDWRALVRSKTTLVIYMGLRNVETIVASLLAAGVDGATPACIIENGTLYTQKQQVTTLGQLSAAGFAGPALIVIGGVVRFSTLCDRSAGALRSVAELPVEHFRDIHVHELRARGEPGVHRDLDAPAGKDDLAGLAAHPAAVGLADKALDEIVHACPLYGGERLHVRQERSLSLRSGDPDLA